MKEFETVGPGTRWVWGFGWKGRNEFGRDRRTAGRGVPGVVSGNRGLRPVFRGMGARVAACDPVPGPVSPGGEPCISRF